MMQFSKFISFASKYPLRQQQAVAQLRRFDRKPPHFYFSIMYPCFGLAHQGRINFVAIPNRPSKVMKIIICILLNRSQINLILLSFLYVASALSFRTAG
ncbi:hypothetical protein LINPERHAP1_LOCUS29877 [Linum perenne]